MTSGARPVTGHATTTRWGRARPRPCPGSSPRPAPRNGAAYHAACRGSPAPRPARLGQGHRPRPARAIECRGEQPRAPCDPGPWRTRCRGCTACPADPWPAPGQAGGHHGRGLPDGIVGVAQGDHGPQGGGKRGRAPGLRGRRRQGRCHARLAAGVPHRATPDVKRPPPVAPRDPLVCVRAACARDSPMPQARLSRGLTRFPLAEHQAPGPSRVLSPAPLPDQLSRPWPTCSNASCSGGRHGNGWCPCPCRCAIGRHLRVT